MSLQTRDKHQPSCLAGLIILIILTGCSTAYKAAPLSFRSPSSFANALTIDGAVVAARAFDEKEAAALAFGFDTIGAGILPVQVVFDNKSDHTFEINGSQTFLEDKTGNLWPILSKEMAYNRASGNSKNDQILKKGASGGLMGATAGAIIGSAIGIVTGTNVGTAAGKGAAIGGSIGLLAGGVDGHNNNDAQQTISRDLRKKALQNKTILPDTLAHGVLFFPAEANRVEMLQLLLVETDTGKSHRLTFNLYPVK